MKKLLCLLLSVVFISSSVTLRTTHGQSAPRQSPLLRLLNIGDRIWDDSAQVRGRLETDFNIKLNKEDAYETWKSASPEFTDRLESLTMKRWGISLIPTKSGWTVIKSKAAPPFGLPPWLSELTFCWFLLNINLAIDNYAE